MFCVVVLYNHPNDPAAFEKYYAATHLPIVTKHAKEIGFTRSVFMKFPRSLDGSKPEYYRKAELWFDSEAALTRGTATPGFAAIAEDLPNFATGGVSALVGQET